MHTCTEQEKKERGFEFGCKECLVLISVAWLKIMLIVLVYMCMCVCVCVWVYVCVCMPQYSVCLLYTSDAADE